MPTAADPTHTYHNLPLSLAYLLSQHITMTKIDDFLDWFANFDQSQQDKLVEFNTWNIPASEVIAQTLDWAFPRGESDTDSGKELVAGYLLNLKKQDKISNPQEAAMCIVEFLLQPSTISFPPFSFLVDIRTGAD